MGVSNRFLDKVAIVTGGAAGMGRAIVEELCKEGCQVLFTDISKAGKLTEEKLTELGCKVTFMQGDMASDAVCSLAVNECIRQYGAIHYLVNNAFPFTSKGIAANTKDWMRSFEAGPLAYARMAQYSYPHMAEAGGGAIVNISSISAHIAQGNRWTYNSAKGAVNQLTKCQALDLAPYGIRVNSIDPGWIWTQETDKAANFDGGGREKWEPIWGQFHMLRRMGKAIEVARPALFLLSDDASFITGTNLAVDGGYLAMGPEGLGKDVVNAGSD